MQFLSTIKDFSFIGFSDPERIKYFLAQNTVFKNFILPNYKDFQTTAPFYIL